MIKTILVILALAILASTSTVYADECSNSKGYRAGRRQVKKMWENRGSCSNIDGFDVAVRRMIQTRFRPSEDSSTSYKHSYNQCAKRGARSMLEKYQQECDDENQKSTRQGGWKDRNRGSIQCAKPRQWKIERDGHEEFCANTFGDKVVPYECEDESKLCCTDSSLTTVTFEEKEEWGECTKIEGQENERERDEDEEDDEFDDEEEYDEFDEEFDEEDDQEE